MQTAEANREWTAYGREDGRKGIRNITLVLYTVECASHVAQAIAANEPDTHVIGFTGCYDNAYAVRLMQALCTHPNVGALLAVGLGCEYTQPEKLAALAERTGRLAEWFFIQDIGGTAQSVAHGKKLVADLRARLVDTPRVSMGLADLVIGCECGGSDFTSGLAGNPAVGRLFDLVVDEGGTAIFEEIVEMIGLRDVLADRAADAAAREALLAVYDKAERYCRAVRQYSVSPGNFTGGLTTIEEKSLGAFSKSGSRPIRGTIKVAQRPPASGLWLLDSVPDDHFMQFGYTNPNDTEGIMDLIAAGAHIVLFVTGRGSLIGAPIAPVLKVTGNTATFERLAGDLDFNAGRILDGGASLEEAGRDLLALTIETAAGKPTCGEALGHREYLIPYKFQEPPKAARACDR